VIRGVHAIIYSRDAEADRAFFRDVLGLANVDARDGWLIFALPPAELAVHPATESGRQELYLMCDDLAATLADLASQGVGATPVADASFGPVAFLRLPGGGELGLYEPRHPSPLAAFAADPSPGAAPPEPAGR
jgi:catechol 2,3-dioxygenase-like lactoylglutathione lyase family enzyme